MSLAVPTVFPSSLPTLHGTTHSGPAASALRAPLATCTSLGRQTTPPLPAWPPPAVPEKRAGRVGAEADNRGGTPWYFGGNRVRPAHLVSTVKLVIDDVELDALRRQGVGKGGRVAASTIVGGGVVSSVRQPQVPAAAATMAICAHWRCPAMLRLFPRSETPPPLPARPAQRGGCACSTCSAQQPSA